MNCIATIPLYTLSLKHNEWVALDRAFATLPAVGCLVAVVAPEGLDLSIFETRYAQFSYKIERFEPRYFAGISGYNALMLSEVFYARFLEYEHLLIYQTDCYIFDASPLVQWLKYDYVGAPWIGKPYYSKPYYKLYLSIRSALSLARGVRLGISVFNQVGNGGLSLRRVSLFHKIAKHERSTIDKYLATPDYNLTNEDVFWSFEPRRLGYKLRKPSCKMALGFSFDMNPAQCLEKRKGTLPMGCHGWNKASEIEFWHQFIEGSSPNSI